MPRPRREYLLPLKAHCRKSWNKSRNNAIIRTWTLMGWGYHYPSNHRLARVDLWNCTMCHVLCAWHIWCTWWVSISIYTRKLERWADIQKTIYVQYNRAQQYHNVFRLVAWVTQNILLKIKSTQFTTLPTNRFHLFRQRKTQLYQMPHQASALPKDSAPVDHNLLVRCYACATNNNTSNNKRKRE